MKKKYKNAKQEYYSQKGGNNSSDIKILKNKYHQLKIKYLMKKNK
jgi:hypothetical protein